MADIENRLPTSATAGCESNDWHRRADTKPSPLKGASFKTPNSQRSQDSTQQA